MFCTEGFGVLICADTGDTGDTALRAVNVRPGDDRPVWRREVVKPQAVHPVKERPIKHHHRHSPKPDVRYFFKCGDD